MPARISQNHPKLWRKSRGGKDYGAYYVTLGGKDVNLGTSNAEEARKRLPEAVKGRRGAWPTDAESAARAMEPTTEQLAAAPPAPRPPPPPPPPPAPEPIAAAPSAPSSPPPVAAAPAPPAAPDPPAQLPPMSEENQRAEAEATNAAAAGTGSATDGAAGATTNAPPIEPDAIFTPGQLDGLLKEVASAIVIGQIELQGYLIKRRTGKIPPTIEPGSKIHEIAEAAWVEQFNQWFPEVDDVPPIALAIGLPMLFMLKQAREAQEPPPQKNGHPGASASTPAPPAAPAHAVADDAPTIGAPPIVVS